MTLATLTPTGLIWREDEKEAIAAFESANPGYRIIHTPPGKSAILDGVIVKSDEVAGVVVRGSAEIKCRSAGMSELADWGSLLISTNKIIGLERCSELFRVPSYVLIWSRVDHDYRIACTHDDCGTPQHSAVSVLSRTQETCEGGSVVRENSYLPWAMFSGRTL